jgi:hypothetical protein
MMAESALLIGYNQEKFALSAAGSKKVVLVTRGQPKVDDRGQTATGPTQNVILGSKHDVAQAGRVPVCCTV